jgi:hypothetical protein
METWKPIQGYEGLYEVSNQGRVRGVKRTVIKKNGVPFTAKECILTLHKTKKGYLIADLWKDNKEKRLYVHRLVAMAFIPNPYGYKEVNHKDENKENNTIDNLEWSSRLENVRHGTGIKRGGISRSKKVYQYDKDGNFIKEWASTRACEIEGYDHTSVSDCCRGKIKTHHGYKWSYEPL